MKEDASPVYPLLLVLFASSVTYTGYLTMDRNLFRM
jgi:hypothetical protein